MTLDDSLESPAWLPLLEQSREELNRNVAEIVKELSIPISFLDFPVREVIASGLMSGRREWVCSALDWLEMEQDFSGYRDPLLVAARSRGAGQRNRQRAWRLLTSESTG
ncbi:hypothetical protein NE236_18770 [Actinoallomurus purpureus]|uniref:hypothetical protein n=1 Tax=Actinoallomurus purpureus TaxID=478114 RepID=UPI002093DC4E|nr:hypothetical protein [Actinoallomurus purpureus]MCO6007031.1 hypothetical protein [Actinoallomurus purpureus]